MNDLKTLDILLCAGNGRFSRIIQQANKIMGYTGVDASISHVALVLSRYRGPVVFESTTKNWNGKKGVQINWYAEWLKHYNGSVYVRRLACEPPKGVDRWMCEQVGRLYEDGLGGLLELATTYILMDKTRIGRWLRGKMKTVEVHCTEIDAECLQEFSLMSKEVSSSKLPPALWYGAGLDGILNCRVNKPEKLK